MDRDFFLQTERFRSDHPDAQWYETANLGLFVHWDVSSVDGTIEMGFGMMDGKDWGAVGEGDPIHADLADGSITPDAYRELAEDFQPEAFDPDRMLAAARRAGFEYAVLTAKHLAGYTMWPSDYGDFGTHEYMDGRDLVGEFVDACRRQGLRAGLYFCMGDLSFHGFPGRADADLSDYDSFRSYLSERRPVDVDELVAFEEYYTHVRGQVGELVTRYGDLDLLWLDVPTWLGGANIERGLDEIYGMVKTELPHVVLGREFLGGGDFQTPENELPGEPPVGWWELCQVWAPPNWGYHEAEQYQDMAWTHRTIARTVSRGGNLLLNVGPDANGALSSEAYDRMDALGEWMTHSAPAIEGVHGSSWPPRANVPVTRRSGTWYAHVLADHEGGVTLRDVAEPSSAIQLRTGEPVEYQYEDRTVTIDASAIARECENEAVAVSWHRERWSRL